MSDPSRQLIEAPSTEKANRIPVTVGFVADVAGVVAFLLAGFKIIALVLGVVAALFGGYLIVRHWGRPFRSATLVAVVILSVGTGIIGVVIGHQLSRMSGGSSVSGADLSTPQSHGGTTSSPIGPSPSMGSAATVTPGGDVQSPSSSADTSPGVNSSATPVNLGDSRQGRLANANGFGTATQVTINAKTFMYGLSGCKIACGSATSDFDLGRSYSTLTARLGVLDSSRTGGSAHIQILADGKVVESKAVQLGVSFDIQISVKNVLRLQFVESNDGGVVAAVGDPTVIP